MNGLATQGQQNIVGFFHNNNGALAINKPFEQEIFLYHTRIAGATHVQGIDQLVENLVVGEKLSLFREPDNEFDKRAIVIKNKAGTKLGYVPRTDNIIFSRLVDAGKCVYAKISKIEVRGTWHDIKIDIFMKD